MVATDDWDSFVSALGEDNHVGGKEYTVGIAGNNCRLRHRTRRAFRRTCCFSKKRFNHWKAFDMAFFTSTMALSNAYHTLWITFGYSSKIR
ncbi:hypothetical protein Holit_00180 [Hollandina sp. SP2]